MNKELQQSNKGILQADTGRQKFSLMRYEPSQDLAPFIEHYWIVQWDLRGHAPYNQVILSYPNVNLSFEREHYGTFAGIYGVPTTPYSRHLEDEGIVLGVKFRPGGFYPFWKHSVSRLTGQIVAIQDIFGEEANSVGEQILAQDSGEHMVQIAEDFLKQQLPEPDENVELISRIVQSAIDNREITKVEDIVSEFGITIRTLQRLFNRYVGVSPKWVIQRYRLQEAAELMEKGGLLDWSQLSHDLGYYDQAHFIKNFKAMIGKSPEEYRKQLDGL
ncbi:MAG: DUF6597 domain-containing transcriptional factor [Candidatus Pristimantibacillus sp.]